MNEFKEDEIHAMYFSKIRRRNTGNEDAAVKKAKPTTTRNNISGVTTPKTKIIRWQLMDF